MASGGQSPWRYLPHRPRSTAAQRQALLAEGVQVSGSGHIDLQHYRWVY
jgi:methylated-DNA-protein-cysteine methyltransferase-like protein